MKRVGIYIIANIASIWLVTQLLTGVQVTGGFLAYLFLAIAMAGINWVVKPIIKFFTLPINFLTLGLFNLILNFILFYALKYVVPGFNITEGEFLGVTTDYFVIPSVHTNLIATIVIGSILIGLMAGLIEWLLKTGSE